MRYWNLCSRFMARAWWLMALRRACAVCEMGGLEAGVGQRAARRRTVGGFSWGGEGIVGWG